MSSKAARLDDHHLCTQHVGEKVLPACAPTILVGGRAAARVGDLLDCTGAPPDIIKMGEPTVLFEGKVAARFSDPTEHGGFIDEGEPTVLIGTISAEAKRMRLMERIAKIDAARRKAATMPPGEERDRLNAAADRLSQNNTAMERARLAQDVYNDDPNSAPEGWRRLNSYSSDTGFYAAAYQSEIDGTVVLAFRGTEPSTWQDWVLGNTQGAGIPAPQYTQAVNLSRTLHEQYGDNFEVTGHSLGGGLASAGAMATGAPGTTFNASGIAERTYDNYGLDRSAAGNINAYRVEGDILTTLQENSIMPDAVGNVHNMAPYDMVMNADGTPRLGPDGRPMFQHRPDIPNPVRAPSAEGAREVAGNFFRLPSWDEVRDAGFNPFNILGNRTREATGAVVDAIGGRINDTKEAIGEMVHRHSSYPDAIEFEKDQDLRTIEGML
jgi:uncharacterized Zn-binding protein involved in type VI secretion